MASAVVLSTSDKIEAIKALMNDTSADERRQIERHLQSLRNERGFYFLDLPGEIRNRIYRHYITTDILVTHVEHGQAPALLKTNSVITSEFKTLYYSSEFFRIQLYNLDTSLWRSESNMLVIHAVIAKWWCWEARARAGTINEAKQAAVFDAKHIRDGNYSPSFKAQLSGVLDLRSNRHKSAYFCRYNPNALAQEANHYQNGRLVKRMLLQSGEFVFPRAVFRAEMKAGGWLNFIPFEDWLRAKEAAAEEGRSYATVSMDLAQQL